MPGGWNVIGTALENVYDPHRDDPFLFELGDRVRFEPARGRAAAHAGPARSAARDAAHARAARRGARRARPRARRRPPQPGAPRHGAVRPARRARRRPRQRACAATRPGTTLIESTLHGPTLTALRDVVVGAAGRGLRARGRRRAGRPAHDARPRGPAAPAASRRASGVRGYLALAGGIEAEPFLGSASVDRYGLIGRALRAGDVLGLAHATTPPARDAGPRAGDPVPPRDPPAPRPAVVAGGRERAHRARRSPSPPATAWACGSKAPRSPAASC